MPELSVLYEHPSAIKIGAVAAVGGAAGAGVAARADDIENVAAKIAMAAGTTRERALPR
jgi:hypothetical protein